MVSKRRKARFAAEGRDNVQRWKLSNRRWRHECKRTDDMQAAREASIRKTLAASVGGGMSYDEACAKLGEFPATVSGYPKYLSHAVAVFTTSAPMVKRMRLTAPRRNRLDKHSNELQAAKKVAEEFLALCKETVILVWGDGNFSPSTKGHAPAPNKRLQRLLSK